LMENTPIRMSPEGFKAFLRAVAGPAQAVPELVEVARRHPPWKAGGKSSRG
jgi:hypothetical protein